MPGWGEVVELNYQGGSEVVEVRCQGEVVGRVRCKCWGEECSGGW